MLPPPTSPHGRGRTFRACAALLLATPAIAEEAIDPERAANTIILDARGVRNLGIETVPVRERTFETTVFAIGRIEDIPSSRSVLSSRISGRAVEVLAFTGDRVEAGQTLVRVESRQPGDPPPVVSLPAPQGGLVIESHVRPGQPVEPEAELLDIVDRSRMWAVARIPEREAALVSPGQRARIRIPALGSEPIEAGLVRFGIQADRQAGTVEGIFELPNPAGSLQPGMRAEFSIVVASRGGVMTVPRDSLQGDPARRVVFVRDFELANAFVRAPVEVGEENDGFVEIRGGLFPGDDVVTRGAYALGFAGGGTISLKEALDAAHGHEHNEDGSEITPEQEAAREAGAGGSEAGSVRGAPRWLIGYAVAVSLALIVSLQCLWTRRKAP